MVRYLRQWYFLSQYLERFGFINERTIPTPVLLSDLRGFPFYCCGWYMEMRVFLIENIVYPLRNIPPASEATNFFMFGKRLGWDCSVLVWACQWVVGDR